MLTENFKIEIRHHNFQGGGFPKYRKMDDHRDFKRPKYNGKTEITIKDRVTDEVLGVGLALCSHTENFVPAKGRIIAFKRASKNLKSYQVKEIADALMSLPSTKKFLDTCTPSELLQTFKKL